MLFTGRTIKIISGDLKSRIDTYQKDCASLKDRFSIRIHVDTNIQVTEMKVNIGTFLLSCLFVPFSNLFAVNVGRMIDDELGASELQFFEKLIIICSIHPADKIRHWLAAPDSSRNKNEASYKRQVHTCTWFLEG